MSIKASYSTPIMHVGEIETSIKFYQLLGFEVVDTDRCTPLGWARLHVEGGGIMFLRAEKPVDPSVQAMLLYMYTPDLVGLREQLLASGAKANPITYPGYMPSGEMRLTDPDGYVILIAHWGKPEQETWEKRIAGNKNIT